MEQNQCSKLVESKRKIDVDLRLCLCWILLCDSQVFNCDVAAQADAAQNDAQCDASEDGHNDTCGEKKQS